MQKRVLISQRNILIGSKIARRAESVTLISSHFPSDINTMFLQICPRIAHVWISILIIYRIEARQYVSPGTTPLIEGVECGWIHGRTAQNKAHKRSSVAPCFAGQI